MAHSYPPAMFIADAPGLDFLNSVATPVDEAVDWLGDGEGLLNWLEQAGLVPRSTATAFRDRARRGELDGVAKEARGLREWFRGFVRDHMGRPLPADALNKLKPLNGLLECDSGFAQLVRAEAEGGKLEFRAMRRWDTPQSLLLPIGETLARFVCTEDFSDVKTCEGHNCTLMFADHTRRRARRWCSMAVCGNRAKQTAHRNRARVKN